MRRTLKALCYALVTAASTLSVHSVAAEEYWLYSPEQQVIGGLQTTLVAAGEFLYSDVAIRSALGSPQLIRVNSGVPGPLRPGTELLLPTYHVLPDVPHRGIVINLPEFRLYYFPEPVDGEPQRVYTYPISIGRMDWETPLGLHRITEMRVDPTWIPTESIRADRAAQGRPVPAVVPPGPDNPLGSRAMRLTMPTYLIHGTNVPHGIGWRVSAGCIRMYEEHVQELFSMVGVGTEVRIINQPIKVGWDGDRLLIEAHAPLEEYAEEFALRGFTTITEQVVAATRDTGLEVDWRLAEAIVEQALGIPTVIAVRESQDGGALNARLTIEDAVNKAAVPH